MERANIFVTIPHIMQRTILLQGQQPADLRVHMVRVAEIESGWQYDLSAPFWRLYVPITQGGFLGIAGKRRRLQPGYGYLLAPDTVAQAGQSRSFTKLFAHFTLAEHVEPGLSSFLVPYEPALDDRRQLTHQAHAFIHSGLAKLNHSRVRGQPRYDKRIKEVLAYIDEHLSQPPSNEELARLVHLHVNSFVRLFSQQVGQSPYRYSLQRRLDHAGRLLVETDASIEQVASASGFSDRHHFTRAFQKRWQCPPATFRQRNQML